MPTPAVSIETVTAAQAGDVEAMWQLVSAHEALFGRIVSQVAPRATADQREDYMQEARACFVERLRLYDTAAGTALTTYIYADIKRAVSAASLGDQCPVSIGNPTTVIQVRKALADAHGDADAAWVAIESGRQQISRGVFIAVVEALRATESLDAPVDVDEGDGLTLADILADPSADVTDPWERRELADWLLTKIRPRESYTLRAFYGVGLERAEDADVAAHLRITPANVRKTRGRALGSCRAVAARYSVSA